MTTAPPTRRRWFQVSSGALLLLVTLVAISTFGVRECVHRERLESRLVVLEAELEASRNALDQSVNQDVKLLKMEEQLSDLELGIAEVTNQIKSKDNPTMRRLTKSKGALEAKIAARRDELLKRYGQRKP